MQRRFSLLLAAPLLMSSPALGHFIWAEFGSTPGSPARIYFSESADPDQADLLRQVNDLRVWARHGEEYRSVETELTVEGKDGWLTTDSPTAPSVEAHCLYGIFTRGPSPMLLHYYAKALRELPESNFPSTVLSLDVVPARGSAGIVLTVLWQGKPAAGVELVGTAPQSGHFSGSTDEKGTLTIPKAQPGAYEVRAKMTQELSGEHKGEPYDKIRHYSTVTFHVPQ